MNEQQVARRLVRLARELVSRRVGKMTPEDYAVLESFLDKVVRRTGKKGLAEYREKLEGNPRIRDADKAFRWGLLNASGIKIGDGRGVKAVSMCLSSM